MSLKPPRFGTSKSAVTSLAEDDRPIRALAASVVLDAVKALKDQHTDPRARVDRSLARVFFMRKDIEAHPCNLAWCCQILGLDPQAMRERLTELNPVAVKQLFWNSDRGKR